MQSIPVKITYYVVLAFLIGSCQPKQEEQTKTPPNIIYILVDDQGWGDVGYNDSTLYTPVIDKMAKQNIRFDYHYVHPQCTPTRVALLTGRYPQRFGLHATWAGGNDQILPRGTPTLASLLKSKGYETALIGKWHLGSVPSQGPNNWGFDYTYGILGGGCSNYRHRYKYDPNNPFWHTWHKNGKLIEGSEEGEYLEEGKHTTDLLTKDAIRFLKQKRDSPFFMYLAYTAPHTPLDEEEKWFQDPEGKIMKIEHEGRRLFAATMHHLDNAIGQVLETLEASGQLKNTIVVYCSDNGGITTQMGNSNGTVLNAGYSSNGELRSQKTHVYEGGVRVPAWVSWPGTLDQKVIKDYLHVTDWLPTLCKLAGVENLPENLDGRDILPMLNGEKMTHRNVYWAWGSSFPLKRQSVRQGPWKLVKEFPDTEWELYNIVNDPTEANNLADSLSGKADELLAFLKQQRSEDIKNHMTSIWIKTPEKVTKGETILCKIYANREIDIDGRDISVSGGEIVKLERTKNPDTQRAGVRSTYILTVEPQNNKVSIFMDEEVLKTKKEYVQTFGEVTVQVEN